MADSFADLWASSGATSSKSSTRLQTLAAQTTARSNSSLSNSSSTTNNGRKYDAFSLLATPSQTGSRPITPQNNIQPPSSKGLNAFEDLVPLNGKSKASDAELSLADRRAAALRTTQEVPGKTISYGASDHQWNKASATSDSDVNKQEDPWDFDLLAAPSQLPSSITKSPSPDPFEFDAPPHRADLAPQVINDEEEDLLGDLGKPVSEIIRKSSTTSSNKKGSPDLNTTSRASSPPHIIGQIVEMGFSPEQARVALASTSTGLDVQAALEILISDANSAPLPDEYRHATPSPVEYVPPTRQIPQVSGQQAPSRLRGAEMTRSPSGSGSGYNANNIQDQADRLLSQATLIGKGMFDRANALWKEGKDKVQKAYEERAQIQSPVHTGDSSGGLGRPKWMAEETAAGRDEDAATLKGSQNSFKDNDDYSLPPVKLSPIVGQTESEDTSYSRPPRVAYQSPFRRSKPSSSILASRPPPQPSILREPLPVRPHKYASVVAEARQIQAAAKNKSIGNEHFKLGRYAESETSFNEAISLLPSTHLLLVPLYTNRALSRLRNGNPKGCIEDSSVALAIIDEDFHPEILITTCFPGEAPPKLDDAFLKALRRRAEGYEAIEKWDLARSDWEKLAGMNWASSNQRSEANAGIGRCRKMMQPAATPGSAVASSPPKPKPKPPNLRSNTDFTILNDQPSALVARIREANSEQDAEDMQRHALKDSVDAKLAAWCAGKESNLRALLANMDLVLWEELKWKKIGMAELISEGQVKVQYTKAIAKVHPDKLSNTKTSLENRMIATGVFATLNQAWVNFKA